MKNYWPGFDVWALALFLILLLPTVLWTLFPPLRDVLRRESVTPTVDIIGSVFQVLTIATLCFVQRKGWPRENPLLAYAATIVCVQLYYAGWVLYYVGITTPVVMLLMTLPPCMAFIFFAIARRNMLAAIFAAGFTVCHLIFALENFIF